MRQLLLFLTLSAIALPCASSEIERHQSPFSPPSQPAPLNFPPRPTLTHTYFIAEIPSSYIFDPTVPRLSFSSLNLSTPQTTTATHLHATPPPEKIKRTRMAPSMVGYIEDASVTSQFRLRFDAALHDRTPDRAEFFYAKCGCYAFLPHTNPAYDPNAPGPGPGIPRDVNFQQLYFLGEYAANRHLSFFTQVPFRWLQSEAFPGAAQAFPNSGGFSDVQVGMKFAPIASHGRYLSLQLRAMMPTGDAGIGLGTNHYSIEPALLYYQRLSERLAVEAEFGDTHPLSSSAGIPTAGSSSFAGDVLFYGVGPSYRFIDGENFHLAGVVEAVGWSVLSGYVTGPANPDTSGVNIVNIKVGPRMSFGAHHSLYLGYGIALTSQNWYHEIFRTEYRYAF